MSNVHDSHIDTSELESFEEFEAEGRRYQTDVDLAALMNSFGLANDNNAQSGPGGQVAVVEAVYEEQRDGEHEGRVDESRSSGMRRSTDTFNGNEDQVVFAGLVSTTPLVIDLDDDSEDEKEDERDVNTLEAHGNNDHAQEGDDLAEVFVSVNGDEGDAEAAAAAIVQLAYEIFDAPDSDDEAEVQVVSEAHATTFLDSVLSELHAEYVASAVVEVQAPPANRYISNIQILGSQTFEGTEEILLETSVVAESVMDLLDSFVNIHDDIHNRFHSADDFLANVQVMKVNHVPGEAAYEIQVHAQSFTSVISGVYVWLSEQPSIGGVQHVAQHGTWVEAQPEAIVTADSSQEQSSFDSDIFEMITTNEETQVDVPTYEAIDIQAMDATPADRRPTNVLMFSPIDFQVTFEGVEFMEIDPHFDEADAHMTYCDEGVVCAYTDEPVQVIEPYGAYEYVEAPNSFDINTTYTGPYDALTGEQVHSSYQGQFEFHSGTTDVDLSQVPTLATQEGAAHHQVVYQPNIQGPAHIKADTDMLHAEANSAHTNSHDEVSTFICNNMDVEISSPLVGSMDCDAPVILGSTNEVSTAFRGKTNKCNLAFDLDLELIIAGLRQLRINDDIIFFGVPIETEYSVEQQRPVVEQVLCRRCESVLLLASAPLAPPGLEARCPVHGRVAQSVSSSPACSTVSLSCEPDFMDISPDLLQDFFIKSLKDSFSRHEGVSPLCLANTDGSHLDIPIGDLVNVNVVDHEDSPLSRGATPSPPPYLPLPVDTSINANSLPIPSPESRALLSEVEQLRVSDLIVNDDNHADAVVVLSGVNREHIKHEVWLPDSHPSLAPPARPFDLRSKPIHQHHLALWSDEVKGRSHGNNPKPPKKKILRVLPLTPKRRFSKDEPAPQPINKPSLFRRTARFLTLGFW